MHCELSIVMPAYNEEACIERVVREFAAAAAASAASFEMVVVDDGSRDSTGEILDRLALEVPPLRVIHQPNGGHGRALRRAFEAAGGEWIFHVDSDDQFDPADFAPFWRARDDYDYLCGYRTDRRDPWHRRMISSFLSLLIGLLFGVRLRDANVPFKLIRRAALDKLLRAVPPGVFAPGIMMSLKAKQDLRFIEMPVRHRARQTGRVSILGLGLLKACGRCVRELWAFRNGSR